MRQQHRRAGRLVLGAALVVVVLEVRARGRLDPVGAVAVIDRVQVVAEDLLLRPPPIEVVGERRLAQLLEDRALVLGGKRNLYELLRDRRRALDGLLLLDVLDRRAGDAAQVDAVVGVEAAILDRDDRVLHHRCDLVLAEVDPALVARQRPDLVPARVEQQRGPRRALEAVDRRKVRRDGHEHPERGRDRGQHAEAEQHDQHPQLADPEALGLAAPPPQPCHARAYEGAGTRRPCAPRCRRPWTMR